MLKQIIVFTSISLLSSLGFSQEKFDQRLLEKYNVEQLSKMQTESPADLEFLTFCLDNAFYIAKHDPAKDNKDLIRIKIADINNINFASLGIDLQEKSYQYFLIEGLNQLLVLRSIEHIKKDMNK
ncbi:MAG: hypothetical protein HOK72_01500 [Flavobacteriales bacterium]|nr:hypothetical protein [Flavobacteriales bacterium]